MPDIIIRNMSQNVLDALADKARASGEARETWLRTQLERLASEPTIKHRYVLKAYGPDAAYATINRHGTTPESVGGGAKNLSQAQFDAYKKAQDYVKRNGVGDRELAIGLLGSHFEEVFEV